MRIVMLGTGTYAVPLLAGLYTSDHDVVGVFTRPETKKNKKGVSPPSPVRARADLEGTKVFSPQDINAASSHVLLRELNPELLVVCDYGQILSSETLLLAPQGGLNLHASLLPKYRGAAPIHWAIYYGDTQTGNTVIQMNAGVDAGPILAQQITPIEPSETTVELEARLATMGSELILKTIEKMAQGTIEPVLQKNQQMTRAPKLRKKDGQIDWSRSAIEICNQIRAMEPWPKTFTHYFDRSGSPLRMIVGSASVISNNSSLPTADSYEPGRVIIAENDDLWVQSGNGILAFKKLQPAGKRLLTVAEFLRGYRVQVGDQFGSLSE
ncbi:MAG: methionyl-tRNA formyltransferase [Planctomycetota bacterium]|nr:methionyl-tRNA formyltransferase [Planctomycetota bacterium]